MRPRGFADRFRRPHTSTVRHRFRCRSILRPSGQLIWPWRCRLFSSRRWQNHRISSFSGRPAARQCCRHFWHHIVHWRWRGRRTSGKFWAVRDRIPNGTAACWSGAIPICFLWLKNWTILRLNSSISNFIISSPYLWYFFKFCALQR